MVGTGLEQLVAGKIKGYKGANVGLCVNPTSITSRFQHSIDILHNNPMVNLVKLFAPEHGLRADAQDMVKVNNSVDPETGLPIYSLYGEQLEPTEQQLSGLDVIFFDIQDIGSRYYTFIYTLANLMKSASGKSCRIVVLDRPNPVNGIDVEGPVVKPGYESFVGLYPIATRHGMTIGELALMFNGYFNINCALEIVKMTGWTRSMDYTETGLPWVYPSPNMPTIDTAYVYPGMCLLEGTNISEGRGTTKPFEIFGAPYINPDELVKELNKLLLPGVVFRPVYFIPTFHKWRGAQCGGAQLHISDRKSFKPVMTGMAIIMEIILLYPEHFQWRQPPYEFETEKLPIHILTGDPEISMLLEKGVPLDTLTTHWQEDLESFIQVRADFLLY